MLAARVLEVAGVWTAEALRMECRLRGPPEVGWLSGDGVMLKLRSLSANLRIWATVKGACRHFDLVCAIIKRLEACKVAAGMLVSTARPAHNIKSIA